MYQLSVATSISPKGPQVGHKVSHSNIKQTAKEKTRVAIIEEKLKAIAQVLASFDLIDNLTKKDQESLLLAIYKILEEREE